MLSQAQANSTGSAMPETEKFDGPKALKTSSAQDKFAANSFKPLPKPGFSS